MKIALIMRGVPGSGKSTLARFIAGEKGVVHSTDDYFYVGGKYVFNPHKLPEFHNLNFEAFCESLSRGVTIVVCDNTNIKRWHFKRYMEAARQAGYTVAIVAMMPHPDPHVAAERTIHNVPAQTIQRMIKEWDN